MEIEKQTPCEGPPCHYIATDGPVPLGIVQVCERHWREPEWPYGGRQWWVDREITADEALVHRVLHS